MHSQFEIGESLQNKVNNISVLFQKLFQKKGFNINSSFDFNIWFIKNYHSNININLKEDFEEKINSTPKEDDDIIYFILCKCLQNEENKNKRGKNIKVSDFINQITNQIISLDSENTRLDKLLNKYKAYESLSLIKNNIKNFSIYEERVPDISISSFILSINEITNLYKGDFKFTLLITKIKDEEETNVLEYNLNNVISNKEEVKNNFILGEYKFGNVQFYTLDKNIKNNDFGIDIIDFQIKIEDLDKNNQFYLTEKYKFSELFVGNSACLMNNFESIKTLFANINILNIDKAQIEMIFKIEFDPVTLMNIYQKIKGIFESLISYKVRVEHKLKTVNSYFPEIKEEMYNILKGIPNNKDNCSIY